MLYLPSVPIITESGMERLRLDKIFLQIFLSIKCLPDTAEENEPAGTAEGEEMRKIILVWTVMLSFMLLMRGCGKRKPNTRIWRIRRREMGK